MCPCIHPLCAVCSCVCYGNWGKFQSLPPARMCNMCMHRRGCQAILRWCKQFRWVGFGLSFCTVSWLARSTTVACLTSRLVASPLLAPAPSSSSLCAMAPQTAAQLFVDVKMLGQRQLKLKQEMAVISARLKVAPRQRGAVVLIQGKGVGSGDECRYRIGPAQLDVAASRRTEDYSQYVFLLISLTIIIAHAMVITAPHPLILPSLYRSPS